MPTRIMDDPERTTHVEQRTWNITHHVQTTILVSAVILILFYQHLYTLLLFAHHLIITFHHMHKNTHNLYSVPLKKTAASCQNIWCLKIID